jgi:hypothetical protein
MKPLNLIQSLVISVIYFLPMGPSAQGLAVHPGSHLVMNGPVNLVLNNIGFSNDGIFTAGKGTVQFEQHKNPETVIFRP